MLSTLRPCVRRLTPRRDSRLSGPVQFLVSLSSVFLVLHYLQAARDAIFFFSLHFWRVQGAKKKSMLMGRY